MKVYCRLANCMFTNGDFPEGIRVVNHEVDINDENLAVGLVQGHGNLRREDGSLDFEHNLFAWEPFPPSVREATEYEPSSAPASDYEDDASPLAVVGTPVLPEPAAPPSAPEAPAPEDPAAED